MSNNPNVPQTQTLVQDNPLHLKRRWTRNISKEIFQSNSEQFDVIVSSIPNWSSKPTEQRSKCYSLQLQPTEQQKEMKQFAPIWNQLWAVRCYCEQQSKLKLETDWTAKQVL